MVASRLVIQLGGRADGVLGALPRDEAPDHTAADRCRLDQLRTGPLLESCSSGCAAGHWRPQRSFRQIRHAPFATARRLAPFRGAQGVRRRRVSEPRASRRRRSRQDRDSPPRSAPAAPRSPRSSRRRHTTGAARRRRAGARGQLVAQHEQPAEQELRQHEGRHELHRLELGAGEPAGKQARARCPGRRRPRPPRRAARRGRRRRGRTHRSQRLRPPAAWRMAITPKARA